MTDELLAEHDLAPGATLTLVRPAHGSADYRLVNQLPGKGLEATRDFDAVDLAPHVIRLSREHGSYPLERVSAGSLEGLPSEYGAVGEALKLIAHGQRPRPEGVTAGGE